VLTALLTGGVAAAVFGVPLTTGLLIGAALSPTDPAILIPLFERMRLRAKVSQTIIAESALNDPTGAVLALAFAGVVLSGSASLTAPMTDFLVDLALSTALGIVFGVVLSAVVSSRRTGIWRESAAIVVIAVVAGSFFSIDSAGGSGYLGAFLAGLILGNMPLLGLGMHTHHEDEMRAFVSTVSHTMVMLVFITLGANLPWRSMADHFWPALAVLATLIFVARPLVVSDLPAGRPARRVDAGGARLPRLDPRDGSCSGRARWDHCEHARPELRPGRHVGRARDHRHARPSVDDKAVARPEAGAPRRRREAASNDADPRPRRRQPNPRLMTIRAKLATAIVVAVAGLALTAGVGIWGMNSLGDKFDDVREAGQAQALALELKYDITDFNGWQTAYGYDNGASRPIFLRSLARFREDLATAKDELTSPAEQKLLGDIEQAFNAFMALDVVAYRALQNGNADEVKRLFLGPEIKNFQQAADGAEELATLEAARAAEAEKAFEDAQTDALRLLILASIIAAVLVALLLITAWDLARAAERTLASSPPPDEPGV
jgi:hypothetical protein